MSFLLQSVSPGAVMTDLFKPSGVDVENFKVAWGGHLALLNAEDVADEILYILSTPPYVNVRRKDLKLLFGNCTGNYEAYIILKTKRVLHQSYYSLRVYADFT